MKTTLITLALILIIAGGYALSQRKGTDELGAATTTPTGTVATSSPDTRTTITLAIGETGVRQGVTITPTKLVSDSRCAKGVQCIWAGTVEVRADMQSDAGMSTKVFEVGTAVIVDGKSVTLVDVSPYPIAGVATALSDYRFTFSVVPKN